MKFIHVVYILLVIALLAVFIGYIPIKQATKPDSLDTMENYIVVKVQKATISQWMSIGDNKGNYDVPRDVRLTGNTPSGYSYDIEIGDNTFVCYGTFAGTGDFHGEKYAIFNVDRWDILYPVKRSSLLDFLLPNSYLCRFDKGK